MGGGNTYPDELIQSMQALSRLVVADENVKSTVQRIVDLAVHAIDGAHTCSISLARKDRIETVAATHDVANVIDQIQYDTAEGPCLSSIDKSETFRIPDMDKDDTWPTFSKRAVEETGIKSMLAYVLEVHDDARAALNLFSSATDAFGDDDVATGSVFAAQAGVALANALSHAADQKKIQQLEEGIETRQQIGQAVGIVMATRQVDEDEAFKILVRISQNANVKLREIAKRLVDRTSAP